MNYIHLSVLKMTEIDNVQYGTEKYEHKKSKLGVNFTTKIDGNPFNNAF